MLLIHDVPINCINQAALEYHVPAILIISVLDTEQGKVGLASPNKNGTFDYGPMQINSTWLPILEKWNYSRQQIQFNPCINVLVGAWILSQEIANSSELWGGIGNYHSHSYYQNISYQKMINEKFNKYQDIIN